MPAHHTSFSRWNSSTSTLTWRGFSYRYSSIIFAGISIFLMLLSRTQPETVSFFRTKTIDVFTPLLEVISKPALMIQDLATTLRNVAFLQADNLKLREENTHLIEWQNAVIALEKENKELRALLNFKTEPKVSYISARVIADVGGAYTRGLIVTAGKSDGVREGMAVMTGEGLIGRVIEVGDWSTRVWLISDLNSRIPITISETGDRGILAGDNSQEPKLLFLARDASIPNGAHVVTSGHGGVFPPNLPIGVLREKTRGVYSVVPSADLSRVTYVRLVDFGLEGGTLNKIQGKIWMESKKK